MRFPVLLFHRDDGVAFGLMDAIALAKFQSRGDITFFRESNVIDADRTVYRVEVDADSGSPIGWLAERVGLWNRPRKTNHLPTGERYSLDSFRAMLLPILRDQEMWEERLDQEELDAALDNARDFREFFELLKSED